jgi:hypothetical protein
MLLPLIYDSIAFISFLVNTNILYLHPKRIPFLTFIRKNIIRDLLKELGIVKRVLAAFLAFSFITASAATYSFIAVSIGHECGEDCDTCEKISYAVLNLSHSVTTLTGDDAVISADKHFDALLTVILSNVYVIWNNTLIFSKVQLNC